MGDKITISLDKREVQGKKVAALRRDGFIPGIVYGHGIDESFKVQAPYQEVEKLVRSAGYHTAVEVTVAGKKRVTMIKHVDRDPVRGDVRHVAFHAVKAGEMVVAEIPIRLTGEGESVAERAGLVVLQAIEQIELRAEPADFPSAIEISIAGLETADDRITFADVKLPKGVSYADNEFDLELSIVNVYEPAALEAANEAAAGDAESDTLEEPETDGEAAGDTPEESTKANS